MKYMLLTYGNDSAWDLTNAEPAWSNEDIAAMVDFMQTEDEKLVESGELVYAEGLEAPAHAKTVQYDGSQVTATDGPYLETKEVLAGFWVVDCASHDRAVEIAAAFSRVPGPGGRPQYAPIEIRPIGAAPEAA